MRRVLLTAAMFAMSASAQAADMPDFLRGSLDGSASAVNWRGFYLGGQAGYGTSTENFNGSTNPMLTALIGDTVLSEAGLQQSNLQLGKQSTHGSGYGAFAGYNWQWDDVVAGLEASYLHGSFGGMGSAVRGYATGQLTDTFFHQGTITSTSQISITDMATFRGRAAYSFGCFLPYVFGGLALGNATLGQSVLVQDTGSLSSTGPFNIGFVPLSSNNLQHDHMIYGYTAGLGIDINLIGGLFMRAEWEYVRFTDQIDTSINTVRAGLGYRF
jgi:outer membrane immunogenic protein